MLCMCCIYTDEEVLTEKVQVYIIKYLKIAYYKSVEEYKAEQAQLQAQAVVSSSSNVNNQSSNSISNATGVKMSPLSKTLLIETAKELSKLATFYKTCQRYSEALPLCLEALDLCEKLHGKSHTETAKELSGLGTLFYCQKRFSEAIKVFERCFTIRKKVLGELHIDTITSLMHYADVLYDDGHLEDALQQFSMLLELQMMVIGPDSPDATLTLTKIAYINSDMNLILPSKEYHLLALNKRISFYGTFHPLTAQSYYNVGIIVDQQGLYHNALQYQLKALEIREKVLESNTKAELEFQLKLDLSESYVIVAELYYILNRDLDTEAIHYAERGLQIREEWWLYYLDTKRLSFEVTIENEIKTKKNSKKNKIVKNRKNTPAITTRSTIVRRRSNALIASAMQVYADILILLNQLSKAKAYIETALYMRKDIFGPKSAAAAQTANTLGIINAKLKIEKQNSIQNQIITQGNSQLLDRNSMTSNISASANTGDAINATSLTIATTPQDGMKQDVLKNSNANGTDEVGVSTVVEGSITFINVESPSKPKNQDIKPGIDLQVGENIFSKEEGQVRPDGLATGDVEGCTPGFNESNMSSVVSIPYQQLDPVANQCHAYICDGDDYREAGQYNLAIDMYVKALTKLKATYGEFHPSLGIVYNHIGLCYEDLEAYPTAELYHQKSLNICQAVYCGEPKCKEEFLELDGISSCSFLKPFPNDHVRLKHVHSTVAIAVTNMANIYLLQKKFDKAFYAYIQALRMQLALHSIADRKNRKNSVHKSDTHEDTNRSASPEAHNALLCTKYDENVSSPTAPKPVSLTRSDTFQALFSTKSFDPTGGSGSNSRIDTSPSFPDEVRKLPSMGGDNINHDADNKIDEHDSACVGFLSLDVDALENDDFEYIYAMETTTNEFIMIQYAITHCLYGMHRNEEALYMIDIVLQNRLNCLDIAHGGHGTWTNDSVATGGGGSVPGTADGNRPGSESGIQNSTMTDVQNLKIDPDFTAALNLKLLILLEVDKWEAAQQLGNEVRKLREHLCGLAHPAYAVSMNNIGLVHYTKRDYAKAGICLDTSLEIRERSIGYAGADTLIAINNIASILEEQQQGLDSNSNNVKAYKQESADLRLKINRINHFNPLIERRAVVGIKFPMSIEDTV